jgi:hypothetical protein
VGDSLRRSHCLFDGPIPVVVVVPLSILFSFLSKSSSCLTPSLIPGSFFFPYYFFYVIVIPHLSNRVLWNLLITCAVSRHALLACFAPLPFCVAFSFQSFSFFFFPSIDSHSRFGCVQSLRCSGFQLCTSCTASVVVNEDRPDVTIPLAFTFNRRRSASHRLRRHRPRSSRARYGHGSPQLFSAARAIWDAADEHSLAAYGFSIIDIVKHNPKEKTIHFNSIKGQAIHQRYIDTTCDTPR